MRALLETLGCLAGAAMILAGVALLVGLWPLALIIGGVVIASLASQEPKQQKDLGLPGHIHPPVVDAPRAEIDAQTRERWRQHDRIVTQRRRSAVRWLAAAFAVFTCMGVALHLLTGAAGDRPLTTDEAAAIELLTALLSIGILVAIVLLIGGALKHVRSGRTSGEAIRQVERSRRH